MRGSGYESLRVTAFSRRKSTQGRHPPVFFRTMTMGAAQGLSEVSIMPLAAISRMSSSAACRLARGSLWGRKRMGAAGPVSMLCCTRAVLVQSSSRAAKMSTKSLNRCRSCSCCDVLKCSPLRRPNSSTATTVSGDGEAVGSVWW